MSHHRHYGYRHPHFEEPKSRGGHFMAAFGLVAFVAVIALVVGLTHKKPEAPLTPMQEARQAVEQPAAPVVETPEERVEKDFADVLPDVLHHDVIEAIEHPVKTVEHLVHKLRHKVVHRDAPVQHLARPEWLPFWWPFETHEEWMRQNGIIR